jgi:UDP-3-O-[3-hydroxymyristoyl] glucosamine N-acyltransferase
MHAGVGTNVCFSPETVLGRSVTVGNNVTFHGKVDVGDDVVIFDGAVLGRPPIAAGNVTRDFQAPPGGLHIGQGSIIGANAVLYTGTTLGEGVLIGDLASLREGCRIADSAVVGRGVLLMYEAVVGARKSDLSETLRSGRARLARADHSPFRGRRRGRKPRGRRGNRTRCTGGTVVHGHS